MEWTDFLEQVAGGQVSELFRDGAPSTLALDDRLPVGKDGISLNKKGTDNPIGRPFESVLALLEQIAAAGEHPSQPSGTSFEQFCKNWVIHAQDASPDTILSFVAFAALELGAHPPADFWATWVPPITRWELTGNTNSPETSWPALASALAHRHFEPQGPDGRFPRDQITAAWCSALPFAVEAISSGYDPDTIPQHLDGRWLSLARAALVEERSRYQRKAFASEIWQLSVPMSGAPRRKLVDAIFTQESELTGVMKVLARNDTAGSPLGHGFSALVIERPELRTSSPDAWFTISLDERSGANLKDLWLELERRETNAWEMAGHARPLFDPETSRDLNSIKEFGRVYHEPWYIDPTGTLIGSPKRQTEDLARPDLHNGTLLSSDEIRDAIFTVLDPLQDFLVTESEPDAATNQTLQRLTEVEPEPAIEGRKRVISAWVPKTSPLPHPAGDVQPLPGVVLRAMAARTLRVKTDRALLDAPDLEELQTVAFGNGLAVVTDGGVFLLDCGRRGPSAIKQACALAFRQSKLADELDRIQDALAGSAEDLNEDMLARISSAQAIARQRELAALNARIVRARTMMDSPLLTDDAGLHPLKHALSERWNVWGRLQELSEDIAALDASTRSAEELRTYRQGKMAAAGGIGILMADAVTGPLAAALGLEGRLGGWEQIAIFGVLMLATAFGAWRLANRKRNT